jgi:hypothetical protein
MDFKVGIGSLQRQLTIGDSRLGMIDGGSCWAARPAQIQGTDGASAARTNPEVIPLRLHLPFA